MNRTQEISNELAFMVWDLVRHGDIETANALGAWRDQLAFYGLTLDPNGLYHRARRLEQEGLISVKKGKKTSLAVTLKSTGDYPEPEGEDYVVDEDEEATESPEAPVRRRRSSSRLNSAMAMIDKLPIDDRLMVAGQIIDDCAGQVAETFERLRRVLA